MSTDFADSPTKPDLDGPPPKKKSWVPTCLIGCGVFAVVVLLACGGITWYGFMQAPILIADAITKGIDESDLPEDEKREVKKQIERVKDAYTNGDIGLAEFGQMAESFAKSPLMAMIIIFAADEKYIKPSGLSDEEKADAKLILVRVARGVTEEKIAEHDMDDALDVITKSKVNQQRQLKDSLTDEEVRKFIAECKAVVDAAEIPDGDYLSTGKKYVKPSALSDQEKADASRVLARVARGLSEEKIAENSMDEALDLITESKADEQRELKDSLTDEEVREFIAACKTVVDEAEIPDENFQVKVSDAVKAIVDELLGEEG